MAEAVAGELRFASDPDGVLMDLLDVRHQGGRADGVDIPQSASFLVAPDGTVLWKKLAPNYRVRPTPDDVLAAIERSLPRS